MIIQRQKTFAKCGKQDLEKMGKTFESIVKKVKVNKTQSKNIKPKYKKKEK